jgi:hypothetical protein
MATWKAEIKVTQTGVYFPVTVEAGASYAAKETIQHIYDPITIRNLHQVSGGGSSFSSGDSGGLLWIAGIGFVLYLLVTYWYIAVPIAAILIALAIYGASD